MEATEADEGRPLSGIHLLIECTPPTSSTRHVAKSLTSKLSTGSTRRIQLKRTQGMSHNSQGQLFLWARGWRRTRTCQSVHPHRPIFVIALWIWATYGGPSTSSAPRRGLGHHYDYLAALPRALVLDEPRHLRGPGRHHEPRARRSSTGAPVSDTA